MNLDSGRSMGWVEGVTIPFMIIKTFIYYIVFSAFTRKPNSVKITKAFELKEKIFLSIYFLFS